MSMGAGRRIGADNGAEDIYGQLGTVVGNTASRGRAQRGFVKSAERDAGRGATAA